MAQKSAPENKRSVLLSTEDNQTVFRLLGPGCQAQSTTVIELYETTPPNHRVWSRRAVGVLCFVKDNTRKNYFFRIYCIINKKMLWEQELYNNMEYIAPTSFMHSFEGDECIVAFNYSNEDEAKHMKDTVQNRLAAKNRRHERRLQELQAKKNNHMPMNKIGNAIPAPTLVYGRKPSTGRRNITKADIGDPKDFKHIGHIGWNRDTGMEYRTEDTALSELFSKAGISENQMQDKATRHFIYDFISKHDTQQIIKDEQVVKIRRAPPAIPSNQPNNLSAVPPPPPSATSAPAGPPVPPRSGSKPTPNRAAPPPPPSVTNATHEHNNFNNSVRGNVPPPRPPPTGPRGSGSKAAIPPPPPANAPAPPPPPSLPVSPMSPPPPPVAPQAAFDNSQPDGRSALLESIRSGTTLRPVGQNNDNQEKPRGEDARGDLLSEIRKGFQLKPCNEREVKPISPAAEAQHNGVNDLAAALSRALAERNRVIHPDDDDDDDSSDSNDEWDD